MREIFQDVTDGYGHDYPEWREVYDPMSVVFDYLPTQEEIDEAVEDNWDDFLRAYYLTSDEGGSIARDRFHQNTGIPPSEIDWDLWREIKRGTP